MKGLMPFAVTRLSVTILVVSKNGRTDIRDE
jgi:hypothetical protein